MSNYWLDTFFLSKWQDNSHSSEEDVASLCLRVVSSCACIRMRVCARYFCLFVRFAWDKSMHCDSCDRLESLILPILPSQAAAHSSPKTGMKDNHERGVVRPRQTENNSSS